MLKNFCYNFEIDVNQSKIMPLKSFMWLKTVVLIVLNTNFCAYNIIFLKMWKYGDDTELSLTFIAALKRYITTH